MSLVLPGGVGGVTPDGLTRDTPRAPTVFKSNANTTTMANVWTPASGKRFRLLRYCIEISANATTAAGSVEALTLTDGGTSIGLIHTAFVPTTATSPGGVLYTTGWVDLGALGYLSGAADNALGLTLSAALTAGTCRIRVAGTEE